MRAVLIISILGLSAAPAFAQQQQPLTISCRAIGAVAEQGETLCINTHGGPRLARCGMVLNVSSWTFLGEGCTLGEPPPEGQADGQEAGSDSPN
jgi:hypothetical protein